MVLTGGLHWKEWSNLQFWPNFWTRWFAVFSDNWSDFIWDEAWIISSVADTILFRHLHAPCIPNISVGLGARTDCIFGWLVWWWPLPLSKRVRGSFCWSFCFCFQKKYPGLTCCFSVLIFFLLLTTDGKSPWSALDIYLINHKEQSRTEVRKRFQCIHSLATMIWAMKLCKPRFLRLRIFSCHP